MSSTSNSHVFSYPSGQSVNASIWAVGFSEDGTEIGWGKTQAPSAKPSINRGLIEYRLRFPSSDHPLGTPKEIQPYKNYIRAKDKWQDWYLYHYKGGDYNYNAAIVAISKQNSIVATIQRGNTDGY
ncbi:hypothetical protein [Candidatus Marithrix sp. Canyon 246]|uniref:hypothetical protein n=1 Tax=Candidatus Marithrix sp. Canyon 246 TaxID=1827136 RepID=UPI000849F5ED|nr:hypothetical protein [Candidatus Marithrix sp. Canyon 246]